MHAASSLLSRCSKPLAAVALFAASSAFAAEPAADSIFNADTVAVVRVVRRASAVHPTSPGLFFTQLEVEATECFKGDCGTVKQLFVWGGRVGDLEQIVSHEPVPAIGEQIVVTRVADGISVVRPERLSLSSFVSQLRARAVPVAPTTSPSSTSTVTF